MGTKKKATASKTPDDVVSTKAFKKAFEVAREKRESKTQGLIKAIEDAERLTEHDFAVRINARD